MNYDCPRINITLPKEVLRQLDVVAKHECASRSDAIRLALIDWIKSSPHRARLASELHDGVPKGAKPQSVIDRLTAEQQVAVKRYKAGNIAFAGMVEAGITPEMHVALILEGEL